MVLKGPNVVFGFELTATPDAGLPSGPSTVTTRLAVGLISSVSGSPKLFAGTRVEGWV